MKLSWGQPTCSECQVVKICHKELLLAGLNIARIALLQWAGLASQILPECQVVKICHKELLLAGLNIAQIALLQWAASWPLGRPGKPNLA
jgi:hypothetical protein